MKKNRDRGLAKLLTTDVTGLFLRWIQGIWSGLSRWFGRSSRPNKGRRPTSLTARSINRDTVDPAYLPIKDAPTSPLIGVQQFLNSESLTVGELMAKVQWRFVGQSVKTVSAPSVQSIRTQIQWD